MNNPDALQKVASKLYTAIVQMAPSDDQIICNGVREAYALLNEAIRAIEESQK